jgi:polyisoprenoid-binding protein YceI
MELNMCKGLFLIFISISFFQAAANAADNCTYSIKEQKLEWTGFKTTKKLPVKGSFKKIKHNSTKAGTPHDLISSLKFSLDTSSVDSRNPVRDKRLVKSFFKLMKGSISGEIVQVKGKNAGVAQVSLTMNGVTKPLAFRFKLDGTKFSAVGRLDILDFQSSKALKALNKACFDLHKGPDGVSKTWSDVEIKISAELKKSC